MINLFNNQNHRQRMNLQTFAETLLFGQTIEDKLLASSTFDFSKTRTAMTNVPDYPGRPDSLSLITKGSTVKFPGNHELENETNRGIIMHFFANHELLAIELMAMALLRFPDAPSSFQKGIVKTIGEEQKHMRLYIQQMELLGVGFGEVGVNSYFWDTMKNMQSPLDYVVQLAMTFEQANLDFAWHYAQEFKKMEITDCSEVMQTVFEDEIKHVQFGVHWFNEWKEVGLSDWEAYCHQLPFPLTPARAKGKVFFDFIRNNTGLSKEFIEQLKIFSHSKGRVPYVKFYNPACEIESHHKGTSTKNKQTLELEHDLGGLMTFLSVASDIVALKKKPTKEFINYLQEIGVDIPQYIQVSDWNSIPAEIKDRRVRGLHPWGYNSRVHQLENQCAKLSNDNSYSGLPENENVYSKAYSVNLFKNYLQKNKNDLAPELDAKICSNIDEVKNAISFFESNGFKNVVLKTAFGVAGQGMVRLFDEPLQESKINWCQQQFKTQSIIVEPWLDKVLDFSMHYDIREEGIKKSGITHLINSPQGQFLASISGKFSQIIPKEILKDFYPQGVHPGFLDELNDYSEFACKELKAVGFLGPVCFDSMLYEHEGVLKCKVCVEINPRYSMGRLCLSVSTKIPFGKVGLLFLLSLKDLNKSGFNSFPEFAQHLKENYPLQIDNESSKWLGGSTLLVDPAISEKWTCCYFVSENLSESLELFKKIKS
ncbi:MAG: hypothetical protein COA79_20050 [Planctomycetota bacterium]|nr:MAG: hypothetical protein COA79_20050 [Planctomycetota bacterium]